MNHRILTAGTIALFCAVSIILSSQSGIAQLTTGFELPGLVAVRPPARSATESPVSTACAMQPDRDRAASVQVAQAPVTLERFRHLSSPIASTVSYVPKEEIALADASNYGDRYLKDINGNAVDFEPIVVLHETVGSADSAINLFTSYHANDNDQTSYHALLRLDGTIVYLVPPDKRAFGAGNSVFETTNGIETVKTNPDLPPSVNNFAYHVSLETPPDGRNGDYRHAGYTRSQYESLAWLVARTGVPDDRITTHRQVDRSRQRIDPRSFDQGAFSERLDRYAKTDEIEIRCTQPS